MTIRNRKPKDHAGFAVEFHEGCRCPICPWKGKCSGENTPHWKARKVEAGLDGEIKP